MSVLKAQTLVEPPPAVRPPEEPRIHAVPGRVHALPTRIYELDGLRGFGALSVVVFHYLMGPSIYSHTVGRIQEILHVWPISVDMFFILSGFLVGGVLLRTKTSPNYFKTFYMRRLYRVVPAYYLWALGFLALAVCLPALRADLLPKGYSLFGYLGAHLVFAQNYPHFPWYQTRAQWFGTTWSLAVEEHFYLIIPFCLYRLSRRRLIPCLSAIILAAPFVRMMVWQFQDVKDPWGVTYVFSPLRSDALALGILLAVLWGNAEMQVWFRERVNWIYFGLAVTMPLSLAIEYMRVKKVPHAGILAVGFGRSSIELSALFLILIALANQGQKSVAFMRWGWARKAGRVSYGIYLAHRSVLWFVLRFGLHARAGMSVRTDILAGVTALALTCGLAALSWKYFEQPLQKRSHRFVY